MPRNHIDDGGGHEKRRNAPRSALQQSGMRFFDQGQTANARTGNHANPVRILHVDFDAAIMYRLNTGAQPASTVFPTGEICPRPVITTRRRFTPFSSLLNIKSHSACENPTSSAMAD